MATGVDNSISFKPQPTMDIYAVDIQVKPRGRARP
jgi:hypothetical protein